MLKKVESLRFLWRGAYQGVASVDRALGCHACGARADLCDVDRLRGLGWCWTCLEGSRLSSEETELGVGG
jgi:hypothetical protein